jgi:hypothetical protein
MMNISDSKGYNKVGYSILSDKSAICLQQLAEVLRIQKSFRGNKSLPRSGVNLLLPEPVAVRNGPETLEGPEEMSVSIRNMLLMNEESTRGIPPLPDKSQVGLKSQTNLTAPWREMYKYIPGKFTVVGLISRLRRSTA